MVVAALLDGRGAETSFVWQVEDAFVNLFGDMRRVVAFQLKEFLISLS